MGASVVVVMEVAKRADSMRTARSKRKQQFQNSRLKADVGPGITNGRKIGDRRRKGTMTVTMLNARHLVVPVRDNILEDFPGIGVAKIV